MESHMKRVALLLSLIAVPSMLVYAAWSSDRLARVDRLFQQYVDENRIAGAVALVLQDGRPVYERAFGWSDKEAGRRMATDTIFRIASQTKAFTSVAILSLMEEGKVGLSDPAGRFIPGFAKTTVTAAGGEPVPAKRAITIRDLLTHTSGLASGPMGNSDVRKIARKPNETLADYIPRLALTALEFQPGTRWMYSAQAGMDTLGRIVEITSGLTFDQFLEQRIFAPLGMKDTAFYPSDDRMARVVTLYERKDTRLSRTDTPGWLATKTLFSGGGGLWSTAEDYMQFAQMLVNGGALNGKRLLSPRTVDLMASNHVRDLYSGISQRLQGMGFGLTVEVVLDNVAAGRRESNGSFGWDGAFGTHFWVDRKEQLVGLLMVQEPVPVLTRDFENAVMQALVE